jgi:hypothetical protein
MTTTPTTGTHDPATDPLYTFAQAAAAFNMNPRTWRGLFNTRAMPLVRIGRKLYVRRSDALAYLTAQTIPASTHTGADR